MFLDLHAALKWDEFPWTAGKTMVVLEEGSTNGSFVIHHTLSMVSKNPELSALLVALHQTKGHYQSLSLKLGENLMKRSPRVQVMEALKTLHQAYLGLETQDQISTSLLNGDLSHIQSEILEKVQRQPIIIIDRLSVLSDLGVPNKEIVKFLRSLRQTAKSLSGTLILITPEGSEIGTFAAHCSDYTLRVSPLKTGFSHNVTGNITYERTDIEETEEFQYRTSERSVNVFARGTSSAVL